jgi:hypothetical protein
MPFTKENKNTHNINSEKELGKKLAGPVCKASKLQNLDNRYAGLSKKFIPECKG